MKQGFFVFLAILYSGCVGAFIAWMLVQYTGPHMQQMAQATEARHEMNLRLQEDVDAWIATLPIEQQYKIRCKPIYQSAFRWMGVYLVEDITWLANLGCGRWYGTPGVRDDCVIPWSRYYRTQKWCAEQGATMKDSRF